MITKRMTNLRYCSKNIYEQSSSSSVISNSLYLPTFKIVKFSDLTLKINTLTICEQVGKLGTTSWCVCSTQRCHCSITFTPCPRLFNFLLCLQLLYVDTCRKSDPHIRKGEVEAVCDKVVILNEGNAVAIGSCNQVKDKFSSGFCLQVNYKKLFITRCYFKRENVDLRIK